MSPPPLTVAAWILAGLAAALLLALTAILLVRAFRSRRLADLRPWHADRVPDELRAADFAARPPLAELLERERALLAAVAGRLADPRAAPLSRYLPGGRRDPGERNRTFLLRAPEPRFGVLMLHGLSDSPYLMRGLGERFAAGGGTVLALRLPGHGTAPGGLLSTRWQDWAAAADWGAAALAAELDGRPLWIAGFSTGATLALHQALTAARRELPQPAARLLLMAPAVELPLVARFALWHRTLAWLPYFSKFRWAEVVPEEDPCKYASFPKRAGAEIFRLGRRVWALAAGLDAGQRRRLPPVLAFQSLADDTLVAGGIARLLRQIGRAGDELVLFDLDRSPELAGRLSDDEELRFPGPSTGGAEPAPFTLTLVSNRASGAAVEELVWPASGPGPATAPLRRRPLGVRWPPGVFSLSHLALPVSPADPLYGSDSELGAGLPRGERKVLAQPLENLIRLRWNPFFDYLAARLLAATPAAGGGAG